MIKSVNAVESVADQIGCDPDDLTLETHTYYGLEVFSNGKEEYAVGTDKEADEACKEYIKDSAWAFR